MAKRTSRRRSAQRGGSLPWLVATVAVAGVGATVWVAQQPAPTSAEEEARAAVPTVTAAATPTSTTGEGGALTEGASHGVAVGGWPVAAQPLVLLEQPHYALGYDTGLRFSRWAAYYCPPRPVFANTPDLDRFAPMPGVLEGQQWTHRDFNNLPGQRDFARGHLVPDFALASRFGYRAQQTTYYSPNATLQYARHNSGLWQDLEATITERWAPAADGLWVLVGPIYRQNPPLHRETMAIADAYFALLVDEVAPGQRTVLALLVPHDPAVGWSANFATTVDAVEVATGLDFFAAWPAGQEAAIEAARPAPFWRIGEVGLHTGGVRWGPTVDPEAPADGR